MSNLSEEEKKQLDAVQADVLDYLITSFRENFKLSNKQTLLLLNDWLSLHGMEEVGKHETQIDSKV
jgi:hypothetical protein